MVSCSMAVLSHLESISTLSVSSFWFSLSDLSTAASPASIAFFTVMRASSSDSLPLPNILTWVSVWHMCVCVLECVLAYMLVRVCLHVLFLPAKKLGGLLFYSGVHLSCRLRVRRGCCIGFNWRLLRLRVHCMGFLQTQARQTLFGESFFVLGYQFKIMLHKKAGQTLEFL